MVTGKRITKKKKLCQWQTDMNNFCLLVMAEGRALVSVVQYQCSSCYSCLPPGQWDWNKDFIMEEGEV